MFSNIFKSKLQHPDPGKRLDALNGLSDREQDTAILIEFALSDPDSKVREHAMDSLSDQISEQTVIDAATAMRLFRVAGYPVKQKLIGHIRDQDCLEQCIASADDQRELILLATKSALPQARKTAADRVCGLENLKQLQLQSNDKNVLQLARQKINTIKIEQKARTTAQQTLGQICEALERIAKSESDPMMASRVKLLESHWNEVDQQFRAEFTDRYLDAVNECHRIIRREQERQALAEFERSQNDICKAICDQLENEITNLELAALDNWPRLYADRAQQWSDSTQGFSPEVTISERYHILKSAADKLSDIVDIHRTSGLDADLSHLSEMDIGTLSEHEQKWYSLVRQLSWPFKFSQPVLISQIKGQHKQIKSQLQLKRNQLSKKRAQVDSKISVLKSHIRQKNLIKANRMLNYIHNLIDELPEPDRAKEQEKMDSVTVSLNELRGLNEFITRPKKLELCEQMEALVNQDMAPPKLIKRIKSIQAKWKTLATSDAAADDVLWERFKLAADRAYLPCAAYLADLEEIKNNNIAARANLNLQLEKFIDQQDWQHVDWKSLQAEYAQFIKQWRSMSPVFFSKNKAHQKKFDALMTRLKTKLDDEKNENHQIYDQLIDRVSVLADSLSEESMEDAIEQVKRIQASWKNVGITHHKRSRVQWQKFQKYCDRVFEYQRSIVKAKRQQANQQFGQVHELVNEIKALIKLPDEQFADSQADFQRLVEAFGSIKISDSLKEKSQRLFERACEDYQLHLSGLGMRAKLQAHRNIRKAAALCVRGENLALSHAGQDELENLNSELKALNLDQNIAAKFVRRLETAALILDNPENFGPEERLANERSLSELAIRLEVLFDLPSPDYALKQRMAYQLEQLQQGLKPALSSDEKHIKLTELELEWYQVGAVSAQARNTLEQRLAAVIEQAGQ